MQNFEARLTGGHPNSLGNTIEVVDDVLADPSKFEELFDCYQSNDEVVRLRVSNAMKRICKANKLLLVPYIDRMINEISTINQASTQWTLATLFIELESEMKEHQKKGALEIMKNNLANHKDWIVLNTTMDTLGRWAEKDEELRAFLAPHLKRISKDDRASVSKKALKTIKALQLN